MTASVDALGGLHQSLAGVFQSLLAVREEPIISNGEVLLDKDGAPIMRKVYPSAAELAAVNTFLKNNNITAVQGNEGKLADLRKQLEERRTGKLTPRVAPTWAAPDPHAVIPDPTTPWQ